MLDQYGRTIDYVRISVTDRCNLRCRYCMPERGVRQLRCADILSYEEILRLCRLFAALGVTKIKLTGGEPLVRRDICDLVAAIKAIDGIAQVTLTTNGVLLADMAAALVRSGLDGVNISLDTLEADKFAALTRRDCLAEVLEGVRSLLALGCPNVKFNCVPIAEVNGGQLAAIAALARELPVAVRFIELMPIGLAGAYTATAQTEVAAVLEAAYGPLSPCGERLGNGPARYYSLPGFRGRIGFIAALHGKFCASCNRVRLTADGFLKLCLQYDAGLDLRALLRGRADDAQIQEAIARLVYRKPQEHHFCEPERGGATDRRAMFQVGG